MDHRHIEEKILEFFDGELGESERRGIEAHLPQCAECTGALERWRRIRTALATATVCRPSGEFVNQVMERLAGPVQEEETATVRFFPGVKWLMPALGYAFALMMMFFAIAQREPIINTETMLLSNIPQKSQWAFSAENPEQGKLVEM